MTGVQFPVSEIQIFLYGPRWTSKPETIISPKKEKPKRKAKKNDVKEVDISGVKNPDKKNQFDFFLDIKEVNKKDGKQFDFTANKDMGNKSERITVDIIENTCTFESILPRCKVKKEHNKYDTNQLLMFREELRHNIFVDRNIKSSKFEQETGIFDKTTTVMGPVIDIDCSGRNALGDRVYRVFNSLFEYKKHCCRNNHYISEGSILRFKKPDNWSY